MSSFCQQNDGERKLISAVAEARSVSATRLSKNYFSVYFLCPQKGLSGEKNYSREEFMLSRVKKSKQVHRVQIFRLLRTDLPPDLLSCCRHRIAFPEVHDLFNVVNHTVKHPLDVDLDMPPQGEPIHPLA